MDENKIMQHVANSLDKQLKDFEDCKNMDYKNKLFETLRISNQIEILNIKTKYKSIFNTTLQTILNLIQKETDQLLSNIELKNMKQIVLIESSKKKLNEFQFIIQELNDENIQLRTQLQIRTQDQANFNLILHYQKMLNDLQLELDEKNNQLLTNDTLIYQKEQLIQNQKLRIDNLEQQINKLNAKRMDKKDNVTEYKQQCTILKEQATQMEEIPLNQYDKLVQLQREIKQKTYNNQSQNQYQNRSQSISLSVTRQLQPIVKDCNNQSPQFIDNQFTKCQTQNIMNNSTLTNNFQLQKKIKIRKKQNLNDLYLYSKSQRNSSINVDQYYEPSLLYRYNVLESIKNEFVKQ